MKMPKSSKGFTIIELLVVIAIVGVLAAILLPVLSKAREKARITKCASNVRQISMGLIMYANENEDRFPRDPRGSAYSGSPAMRGLNLLFDTYITDGRVFNCPSDANVTDDQSAGANASIPGGAQEFTKGQCSYGYDMMHTQMDATSVALVADRPPEGITLDDTATSNSPNHDGRGQNVGYVDGHVEFVDSPLAGWHSGGAGGVRDNIYTNTADDSDTVSAGGTDSVILHDGPSAPAL